MICPMTTRYLSPRLPRYLGMTAPMTQDLSPRLAQAGGFSATFVIFSRKTACDSKTFRIFAPETFHNRYNL